MLETISSKRAWEFDAENNLLGHKSEASYPIENKGWNIRTWRLLRNRIVIIWDEVKPGFWVRY
jgi:hypothetical protein